MVKKIAFVLIVFFLLCTPLASADYYSVTLTRKDSNWYKIENVSGMYIRTKYCYEYVYWDDCTLEVDGMYTKVKIRDTWYDVEGVYSRVRL